MAITTSTSLTEMIQSEIIASVLIATAYENVVVAKYARFETGLNSPTASWPQLELDAVEALTTEGTTTYTAVELQSTELAAVTAGVVGILRDVTEYSLETNMLGAAGLESWIVNDGAILCATNMDNDLCALFAGFTASAGQSGVDFSVSTFIQALGNLDATNAKGRKVCVLDNQQLNDFRTDLATTGAAVFSQAGVQSILNRVTGNDGVAGEFMGVEVSYSNQCDTADGGANVVGWMGIDGSTDPAYASLGVKQLWAPRVRSLPVMNQSNIQFRIDCSYGVGRISQYATDITTDA